MDFGYRGREEIEDILGKPGNRSLTLDPTKIGQEVNQGDAASLFWNSIRA